MINDFKTLLDAHSITNVYGLSRWLRMVYYD